MGNWNGSVDNGLERDRFAAYADVDARADFIFKTYLHLAGAIALFVALEAILLNLSGIENLVDLMVHGGRWSWLVVLALFIGVSHVANRWAESSASASMQYLGLGLYVVAEAVIFVPLLFIAGLIDPRILPMAGGTTLIMFAVLTAIVFATRKDFSFLRGVLFFATIAALGVIVLGIFTGFVPWLLFAYAMVVVACGYILYDTSNVLHHYRIGQHVAASLALFASLALLFWYVVQIFMSRRN
jgi:FtsH-binding integral membrane protein